jgi:hypothetical protein
MAVGNRLARHFAYVNPDVEAFNQIILLQDVITHSSDQPLDGERLGFREIKKRPNVPPGENENMQWSYRISVPDGEGQVIFRNNAGRMDGAEHAGSTIGIHEGGSSSDKKSSMFHSRSEERSASGAFLTLPGTQVRHQF